MSLPVAKPQTWPVVSNEHWTTLTRSTCYGSGVAEEGKSGKRVVAVLLGLVLAAAVIAWVGATQLKKGTRAGQPAGDELAAAVLSEGVCPGYHRQAGPATELPLLGQHRRSRRAVAALQ